MRSRLAFSILAVVSLSAFGTTHGGISNFAISSDTYSVYSDVETVIDGLFGEEYRLADWTDILNYYNDGHDMQAFTDMIPGRTMVSYYGDRFWTSDRHYFINISNHNTPSGFLVHSHIDNHLIDLGSWWNDRYILAYTDSPSPAVPVPGALALGSIGVGLADWLRRRRAF